MRVAGARRRSCQVSLPTEPVGWRALGIQEIFRDRVYQYRTTKPDPLIIGSQGPLFATIVYIGMDLPLNVLSIRG